MITVKSPGNWVKQELVAYENTSNGQNTFIAFDVTNEFQKGSTNIFVQVEPHAIYENVYKINLDDYLIKNANKYDLILTQSQKVLSQVPHSRLYIQGTTWIWPHLYKEIDISKKKFCVSSVTGKKLSCVGHRFRQALWNAQNQVKVPSTFQKSNAGCPKEPKGAKESPPLTNNKAEMFLNYQQSIVIENSRQENQFTEKLIDCLITKTIPIQYGCPNISNYFVTDGWILLTDENVQETIQKINSLQEHSYSMCLPTIEENYTRCLQYINFYDNVNRALKKS